ncbi:unnamed protein product [Discula destructiva]
MPQIKLGESIPPDTDHVSQIAGTLLLLCSSTALNVSISWKCALTT